MNSRLFSEILSLSLEHLELVGITILIAAALALPGAVLLTRRARLRRPGREDRQHHRRGDQGRAARVPHE